MLTDKELAAVPEELLEDLLRNTAGGRDALPRLLPAASGGADGIRPEAGWGQKKLLRQA